MNRKFVELYQTEAAFYADLANSIRLDITQSLRIRANRYSRYAAADYKIAREEMGITDQDQFYA